MQPATERSMEAICKSSVVVSVAPFSARSAASGTSSQASNPGYPFASTRRQASLVLASRRATSTSSSVGESASARAFAPAVLQESASRRTILSNSNIDLVFSVKIISFLKCHLVIKFQRGELMVGVPNEIILCRMREDVQIFLFQSKRKEALRRC